MTGCEWTLSKSILEGSQKETKSENKDLSKEENGKEDSSTEAKKAEKSSAQGSSSGAQGSSGAGDPGGTDAFEESLMCIICQEILHDCIRCVRHH